MGQIPLNYLQANIYLQEQKNPNAAYNLPRGFVLLGELNIEVLEGAIRSVIHKHFILKSKIIANGGNLFFQQLESPFWRLLVIDAKQFFNAEQLAIERFKQEEKVPFDLNSWPLFRICLFKINKMKSILLFNFHHIIFDMNSYSLVFSEIEKNYNLKFKNKHILCEQLSSETNKPTSFPDYFPRNGTGVCSYSEKYCNNLRPVNWIGLDSLRAVWNFQGAEVKIIVNRDIREKLKYISGKMKVTLSMTLLALYVSTLFDYIKDNFLYVFMQVSNREETNSHQRVGLYLNSLICYMERRYNGELFTLLQKVRQIVLQAYDKYHPLMENVIARKANSVGYTNRPLPQFCFDYYEMTSESNLSLQEILTRPLYVDTFTAKRDLSLSVRNDPQSGVTLRFEYSTQILNSAYMKKFIDTFLEKINTFTACDFNT